MAGFESQNFDPMVSDSAFFFQESSHHLTFIPTVDSDEWRDDNAHNLLITSWVFESQ